VALKTAWRDGTARALFERIEFLECAFRPNVTPRIGRT